MKVLTLNTHSLEEKDMAVKQQAFADEIALLQPDVIALQEVNQTMSAPAVTAPAEMTAAAADIPLRADNHALAISHLLEEKGLHYYWAWLPIKVGYSKYDEGLALFSKKPILAADDILVSRINDYANYRTRRILGIETEDGWFYDCHMSWWNDPDEPFAGQWDALSEAIKDRRNAVLLGDFNGDAAIRNENYDLIASSGWKDTYTLAENKDEGWTVSGAIDGWKDKGPAASRRIDQIWIRDERPVRSSQVVFNGREGKGPIISDHFGILAELEEPSR